jgi:hypothetical protein
MYIFLSVLENCASHYSMCMLITEIYHETQGIACLCLNQKYLSNAKVVIFWNVMRSLADDASVLDKKILRTYGRKGTCCG